MAGRAGACDPGLAAVSPEVIREAAALLDIPVDVITVVEQLGPRPTS